MSLLDVYAPDCGGGATDPERSQALFPFSTYTGSPGHKRTALHPFDADLLTAEAIEQVMRVCDDEDLVLNLLAARPGTPAAAAVAGRLMSTRAVRLSLTTGCPVLAFATGSGLNVGWRRWCNTAPGTLFAELQLYRNLISGDPCTPLGDYPDVYAELEDARLLRLSS